MNDPNIIKLFYDNKSDAPYRGRFGSIPGATLSNGEWVIPLSNLQDPELGLIARSRSADPDDATMTVTFTSMVRVNGIFLCNTNFSVASRFAVTGYFDRGRTEIAFRTEADSYPGLGFTEDLEWEAENSWDGKALSQDLEGLTQNSFLIMDEPVLVSALDIRILDEDNPDGFVQIGRLLCAGGWQPSRNPLIGSSLGLGTGTTVETSMSGAEDFDRREPYRVYTLNYGYLPEQEALERGLEMARRIGIDGEVFVVDDAKPINLHRLSFLARLQEPPAWERSAPRRANISFQLKERLP